MPLLETGEEKIDTEKSAVRRGAEFGVMWPEAEDGREPQEAGGGGSGRILPSRRERGHSSTLISDSWPPDLGEEALLWL